MRIDLFFPLAASLLWTTAQAFYLPQPFNTRTNRSKGEIQRQATWSNGQAVQDYQNFLSSGKQEIELTNDGPSVILRPSDGSSTRLADALVEIGLGDDLVMSLGQALPQLTDSNGAAIEYPIYITLPPTQIADFLSNLPEDYKARTDDFVFFAGGLEYGNIEDTLKERGYCRDTMTQVLISGMRIFGNNQVEDTKISLGADANGEDKLAGECTACGKWAGSIAARLERSNVYCRTEFYREWRRKMWERSIYDAIFNLIGAIRDEPTTLANVANYYHEEVGDIIWEMSQLLRGWKAITLTYGFEDRLLSVGEASGDIPCAIVNDMYPYVWGNKVLLQSKTFVEYLQYAQQEKGLFQGVTLPRGEDSDFSTRMRQGNMRADGVI